jgi:hypothetical protein
MLFKGGVLGLIPDARRTQFILSLGVRATRLCDRTRNTEDRMTSYLRAPFTAGGIALVKGTIQRMFARNDAIDMEHGKSLSIPVH